MHKISPASVAIFPIQKNWRKWKRANVTGWKRCSFEAITLSAGSADLVRQEVQELRLLAVQAKAVEDAGTEAKLSKLKALLQKEGFFDDADQRLLLFTEFKDTLDYLVGLLKSWGFRVGCIHGGMKSGSATSRGPASEQSSSFAKARFRFLWLPKLRGRASICKSATFFSITISPGTRTALSSGWAAFIATGSVRTA